MLRHRVHFVVAVSIAIASSAVLEAAAARDVEFGPDCQPALTRLERRMLDLADADTGALRQFLFSRRAIYDLPIYETAVWAERIGRQRKECLRAQAPAGTQVLNAPATGSRTR